MSGSDGAACHPAQTVRVSDLDLTVDLAAGEEIETEISAKFRREGITAELEAAGFVTAAATEEFSEYGLAGARIDRIAERAGANKRLLYVYFGDKDTLFDAVIERQIGLLAETVPSPTAHDLGSYAGARFDHMLRDPQAARLAAWRAFERAEPTDAERRGYKTKVNAIARAQREGKLYDGMPALDMFAIVLRMTESWLSAPPALMAVAGTTRR